MKIAQDATEALKPCPFCGKPGAICVLEDEPGSSPASFWVNCFCGIETPERRTEQEAVELWNIRAPAQTPCTVHNTVNDRCTRCGETILRASAISPPQPASTAEECAKIAESHVGSGKHPEPEYDDPSYDEACRDIAKAIRDTFAGAPVFAGGGNGTFNEVEPDDDIVRAARALHTSQEQKP